MTGRDDARAILERLIVAYNEKDDAILASLYHPDVRLWSSLGESTEGREQVLQHVRDLFRRLPDERMAADTVVTDGDTVVVELTSRGSSNGSPYEIRFTEVFEIDGGLIAGIKTYIDPEDVAAVESGH
jgi:uncharacterized protein (TIGR02246 family)